MEVTVEHLGALQFEIKTRHHVIVSDQPPETPLTDAARWSAWASKGFGAGA